MNETVEATGPPRLLRHDAVSITLGEDSLPTSDGFAAETADSGYQLH